ncbi:MAG: DNA repair protein RadC [Alphaproteobacteria bacterium]|nr:DNA repair protein RadC [Alphaproteobacteria bacterium]
MEKEEKQQPHYVGHRMRLKERFLKDEGKTMPDYEILELLLTLAIPRRDVKEKAKELIAHFGGFGKVISAPYTKLTEFGLSKNVITVLKLVKASAIKMTWQELNESDMPILCLFDYLIDYCKASMSFLEVEEFRVIFLDAKLQILKEEIMQRGTINCVAVHPREILLAALDCKATSVVLVHNHPSSSEKPSAQDIKITNQIIEALKIVDIVVQDHIIITPNGYYSFKENKLIK